MAIFSEYISLKEAAQISGYHSDYIGALIRSGKIKGKKIGNRWTVSKVEVVQHFSKKHFVSASRVFISRKTFIFGALTAVVVLFFSVLFMQPKSVSSVTTQNSPHPLFKHASTSIGNTEASAIVNDVIIQQP